MATNLDKFFKELGSDKQFQSVIRQDTPSKQQDAEFENFLNSSNFDNILKDVDLTTPTAAPSPTAQRVGQALPGVVSPQATTGQAIGQALTTPIRGIRGLAVGAERVLRPLGSQPLIPGQVPTPTQIGQVVQGIPEAVQRGAEAVKPGFEPEDQREALASAAAEIGAITLFTAPLGGVGAAGRFSQVLKAIPGPIKNALLGGSASAISNAVDKGEVDTVDVGLGAITGGAVLPLVGVTAQLTGRFTRALTRILGSGVLKNIQPSSVRAIEQTPAARITQFFAKDPIKATRNTILNVQAKSASVHAKTSQRLNETRAKIGLGPKIDEDILTANPDFTPEDPNNMIQKFRLLTDPGVKRTLESNAHLRELLKLKSDFSQFVRFNKKTPGINLTKQGKRLVGDEVLFANTLKKIDRMVDSIPGGQEQLRMNKIWSTSKKIHDNVTEKILNDQTGPAFLKKTLLGDNLAELTLPKSELAALKRLERRSGTKFINDLKTDISLLDADDATVRGNILGIIANTIGARNTSLLLRGGQSLKNVTDSLSNLLQSPVTAQMVGAAIGRQGGQ